MPLPSFPRLAFVFREAKNTLLKTGGILLSETTPYETP